MSKFVRIKVLLQIVESFEHRSESVGFALHRKRTLSLVKITDSVWKRTAVRIQNNGDSVKAGEAGSEVWITRGADDRLANLTRICK
jgi:hypothetical protein